MHLGNKNTIFNPQLNASEQSNTGTTLVHCALHITHKKQSLGWSFGFGVWLFFGV